MDAKIFEIRDEGTFISCLAVKLSAINGEQAWYLRRSGYPAIGASVLITALDGERHASADPFFWGGRTWPVAHRYIAENFDALPDGAVVDVSYILGERPAPKVSERFGS